MMIEFESRPPPLRGRVKELAQLARLGRINRRVSVDTTKGCHAKRPCPWLERRARVLTPAIMLGGLHGWAAVGSEGGQGQEFLGVRECLPGNEGESFLEAVHQRPQGRCCLSLKRTPRREEAANIFSSLVQLHGGGEGNFRSLGGGICLIPDYPVGWIGGCENYE